MPERKINAVLIINLELYPFKQLPEEAASALKSWVDILDQAVYENAKFYAHLCVSGPLLNALQREEHLLSLQRLRILVSSGQLGVIAALLDNNLIELSGRPDDFYYQLNNYAALASAAFGVRPPGWEGIYWNGYLGEYSWQRMARAAGELNAVPLLIISGEPGDKCGSSTAGTPEQSFGVYRQEIGGVSFYAAPVHHRFEAEGVLPDDLIPRLVEKAAEPDYHEQSETILKSERPAATPLVVIEYHLDFSFSPDTIIEGAASCARLIKQLLDEPAIELVTLRSYLEKAGDEGKVLPRAVYPMPPAVRCSLRDLEEQQHRLETLILWNLRQRFAQAKDWLDLLGFGISDSNRRFEVMEDLLARFFPQTRLPAYRLLHRLRCLVYPPRAERAEYEKQQACLMIAHRLAHVLLALFKQRDPGVGLMEKRDWDGDGREEVVISNRHQTLVVRADSGKAVFHQYIDPGTPIEVSELSTWLETRLDYSAGVDFRPYVTCLLAEPDRGWAGTGLFIKTHEGYEPLRPAAVPLLKVEGERFDNRGLEVKITRREEYLLTGKELLVDIKQVYRLEDNLLEVMVEAAADLSGADVYFGMVTPSPKDTPGMSGIITCRLPQPAQRYCQSTPLYQFDDRGRVELKFSICCEECS